MHPSFNGSRHIFFVSTNLSRRLAESQKENKDVVVCSFLEFADGLTGKFIIRINLWNPRDIRDSVLSEMRGVVSGSSL